MVVFSLSAYIECCLLSHPKFLNFLYVIFTSDVCIVRCIFGAVCVKNYDLYLHRKYVYRKFFKYQLLIHFVFLKISHRNATSNDFRQPWPIFKIPIHESIIFHEKKIIYDHNDFRIFRITRAKYYWYMIDLSADITSHIHTLTSTPKPVIKWTSRAVPSSLLRTRWSGLVLPA